MKLSVIALTRNGGWRVERMLASVVEAASEIVIGVDATTTDDTFDRALKYTANVFHVDNPQGYIEPHIEGLVRRCTGDWILRLDDDEIMSTNFALENISADILARYDLIGFPRPWLVNVDPPFFVGTGDRVTHLNPQYRLIRRKAQWEFADAIHTPGFEMKTAYEMPNMFIYHMDLLDKPIADRRRKFDFYQSHGDRPWNRDYLMDPEELYKSGNALPCADCPPGRSEIVCYDKMTMTEPVICSREMYPPVDLFRAVEGDFPSPA